MRYYIVNNGKYLHKDSFTMVSGLETAFVATKKDFANAICRLVNNYCRTQNKYQEDRFDDVIGCKVEAVN